MNLKPTPTEHLRPEAGHLAEPDQPILGAGVVADDPRMSPSREQERREAVDDYPRQVVGRGGSPKLQGQGLTGVVEARRDETRRSYGLVLDLVEVLPAIPIRPAGLVVLAAVVPPEHVHVLLPGAEHHVGPATSLRHHFGRNLRQHAPCPAHINFGAAAHFATLSREPICRTHPARAQPG